MTNICQLTSNNLKKILMKKSILLITCLIVIFAGLPVAHAQVGVSVDVVSRYLFRGADFGNAPNIQPTISYTISGFEIGAWAAYPVVSPAEGGEEEIDFYLTYSQDVGSGAMSVGITDYYYPHAGAKFFDFDDGTGAHAVEGFVEYSGLIRVFGTYVFHNDEDNSVYLELGYSRELDDATVDFFAGASLVESAA